MVDKLSYRDFSKNPKNPEKKRDQHLIKITQMNLAETNV